MIYETKSAQIQQKQVKRDQMHELSLSRYRHNRDETLFS